MTGQYNGYLILLYFGGCVGLYSFGASTLGFIRIFAARPVRPIKALTHRSCLCFQYKSKSTKVIENLKYKAQVLEAKREELELEKKALQ